MFMDEKAYLEYLKEFLLFKIAIEKYRRNKISDKELLSRFSGNFQYFLSPSMCGRILSSEMNFLNAVGDSFDFDKQMYYGIDPEFNHRLN